MRITTRDRRGIIYEAHLLSQIKEHEYCARISPMKVAPQDAGRCPLTLTSLAASHLPRNARSCWQSSTSGTRTSTALACGRMWRQHIVCTKQLRSIRPVGEAYQVEGNPFEAAMAEGFHLFGTGTAGALRNPALEGTAAAQSAHDGGAAIHD